MPINPNRVEELYGSHEAFDAYRAHIAELIERAKALHIDLQNLRANGGLKQIFDKCKCSESVELHPCVRMDDEIASDLCNCCEVCVEVCRLRESERLKY